MTSKRGFRASEGEAPCYPTHDAFDRRGFLARLGLGLLAAGAGCVDPSPPPNVLQDTQGLPRTERAPLDAGQDLADGRQPQDASHDLLLRDTAGKPDSPPAPHDLAHDKPAKPDVRDLGGLPSGDLPARLDVHDLSSTVTDAPEPPLDGGEADRSLD